MLGIIRLRLKECGPRVDVHFRQACQTLDLGKGGTPLFFGPAGFDQKQRRTVGVLDLNGVAPGAAEHQLHSPKAAGLLKGSQGRRTRLLLGAAGISRSIRR